MKYFGRCISRLVVNVTVLWW